MSPVFLSLIRPLFALFGVPRFSQEDYGLGAQCPLLPPHCPLFLAGDKSPAGKYAAGCLAVATVTTRRSLRSQRSLPAGSDRCDRSDRRVVTVATAKQPAAYLPAGDLSPARKRGQ